MNKIFIDSDITKAETLPASFYKNSKTFELLKDKLFLKSWQWIGDEKIINKNSAYPITLLENYLTEPILLTRSEDEKINCVSNVCSHRGNILIDEPVKTKKIICKYHGRRFNNRGGFEYMPEFDKTLNFPRECDNLHRFPLINWHGLLFVGLNPLFDLNDVLNKIEDRIGFLPLNKLLIQESLSKNYEIDAHWALYCDNYLEGFHVPFVHKDLNEVLDYENYDTEIYDYFNLQIGYATGEEDCFAFPKEHVDNGKKIAAYYYWIFPNLMLNVYPWGISVNLVKPQAISHTKIIFRSYVFDESKLNMGASGDLDKVEMEDEYVVQNVQKGVNSSFYKTGRFSPTKEKGVHHFHNLISNFINKK
jgi:choline monooxygenase